MKALLCTSYGPPDTLQLTELPSLTPKLGEVIIAMRACSINFPDTLIIENKYQFKPELPFAPGGEVAGVIKAVGEGVNHWQVGQRVFAFCGWGGFAEEVAVAADRVFPLPDSMDFVTGASLLYTYATSLYALKNRGNLQPGETLLVLGAAGGIGMAAVEIGKQLGAKVIAAASTTDKLAVCKAKGADLLINYETENLKERIAELTDGKGVDVVLDPVGGPFAEPAVRSMAWGGRYLVVGFAAGDIPKIPLNLTLLKGCSIVGVFWGRFSQTEPAANLQNVQQLVKWYEAGKISTQIHEYYTIQEGARALNAMKNREVKGKAVIINQLSAEKPVKPHKPSAETALTPCEAFENIEALKSAIGRPIGPTPWLHLTQERINAFADVTIDDQWIHTQPIRAAATPFGGTIAHGLLTLSLTPYWVGQLYQVDYVLMGINYGMNRVRFLRPVPAGSHLRMRGIIKAVEPATRGWRITLEATIEGDFTEKPVCVAELISIMVEK